MAWSYGTGGPRRELLYCCVVVLSCFSKLCLNPQPMFLLRLKQDGRWRKFCCQRPRSLCGNHNSAVFRSQYVVQICAFWVDADEYLTALTHAALCFQQTNFQASLGNLTSMAFAKCNRSRSVTKIWTKSRQSTSPSTTKISKEAAAIFSKRSSGPLVEAEALARKTTPRKLECCRSRSRYWSRSSKI